MKIIALSGGVASGKNFIASILATRFNCEIFDADQKAHSLLKHDPEVFEEIKWYFPNSIINDKIDRQKLGSEVFQDKEKLQILEKILHPRIKKNYDKILQNAGQKNVDFLVLNIPLLIEKGNYNYDSLIAIITDKKIRLERFVKRELAKDNSQKRENLVAKFNDIVANQANDEQRTSIAHFVLDGGLSEGELVDEIKRIARNL